MADTKISALTATTTLTGSDEFAVNQGGVSKKVAYRDIVLGGYTTTATATGTTTLTNASTSYQIFTGILGQTLVLPDATTMAVGDRFYINNNSTGSITINTNGGALLLSLAGLSDVDLILTTNTPAAGVWDSTYFAIEGINTSEQWQKLNSTYPLTSSTALQKLFNGSTNGALTVLNTTQYFFECVYSINTMSATSGNASFDILGAGSATFTNVSFYNIGADPATSLVTVGTVSGAYAATKATAASAVTAATNTTMWNYARGQFLVSAGGTIIPSIALVTANAAVVQIGSYIRVWKVGNSTQNFVGNWS